MLREWLELITENATLLIDAAALLLVAYGTIEAIARITRAMWTSASNHERRDVWLGYARWLVAALTFQLAADILETSVSTNWESIGRLGAIAVIRTFLEYFLGRDVSEVRDRQHETLKQPARNGVRLPADLREDP